MEREKTANINGFADAADQDWYLSSTSINKNHTLSVKLNNGKTYKYIMSKKTEPGDLVIIDFGGATSYEMGNVDLVEEGLKVKRDYALLPLFTFSRDPVKNAIKKNVEGIKALASVEELEDRMEYLPDNYDRFRVVDYLVQSVLSAITVLAFPTLASSADLDKAKDFLTKEHPVPSLVFGRQFYTSYYSMSECGEVIFTGFYPGWQKDMTNCAFLKDPKLVELNENGKFDIHIDDSYNNDYTAYFYFNGNSKIEKIFVKAKDFAEFTNELVYRSALSILIRGGFVNLLKAALSVEMPIKGFYDKLIAFAEEIGSENCAAVLSR